MAKKEKKYTLTVSFSEEKMEALELYLKENDSDLELEMEDYLEKLFQKYVPSPIRKYLSAKEKKSEQKPPANQNQEEGFGEEGD